jgi:hypothetical protein
VQTTPPREKTHVENYSQDEMLPLETKQSGGKLLPHSDLRGRVFLEVSRSRKRKRMGEEGGVHRVLMGKPEGKSPLGRPRRRWEDNINMDVQEVGGGRGDWMEWAQDRDGWRALVSMVKNFRIP